MTNKIIKVIPLIPGVSTEAPKIQVDLLNSDIFWEEYVSKHQPLVIKGAAKSWPAIHNWAIPGYLESHCGDEQVHVSRTFNPVPSEHYWRSVLKLRSFKQSILEMRDALEDETYSIPGQFLPKGWSDDLKGYPFLNPKHDLAPRMYSSKRVFVYKNASTEWHYHVTDETLTTQLVGKKNISLFRLSPKTWTAYSQPIEANFHHMSCRDHFFPEHQQITKYHATLDPGDVLYLPPFWWHGIDTADTDIGVTLAHCFRTPVRRLADWSEPITKANILQSLRSNQILFAKLVAQLVFSSACRAIKGEPWLISS